MPRYIFTSHSFSGLPMRSIFSFSCCSALLPMNHASAGRLVSNSPVLPKQNSEIELILVLFVHLNGTKQALIFRFLNEENVGIDGCIIEHARTQINQYFRIVLREESSQLFAVTCPHPFVGSDEGKMSSLSQERHPFFVEQTVDITHTFKCGEGLIFIRSAYLRLPLHAFCN